MNRHLLRAIPLAICGVLLAVAAVLTGVTKTTPPVSDSDRRIQFYRARVGGPGTYPAYARLGAAYLQKARETGIPAYYGEAERHLAKSLSFQRNFEALRWLSAVDLAQHRFAEALAHAKEAVDALPNDIPTQGLLFDAYLALGEHEKAAAVGARMMKMSPGFESWAREANLRQYRGDLNGAVEALQVACKQSEKERAAAEAQAWCKVRLGSLYLSLCDVENAERAFNDAIRRLPTYFMAQQHKAELRVAQGKLAEAEKLYQDLLTINPEPGLKRALADIFDLTNRPVLATQHREDAIRSLRRSVASGSRSSLPALVLTLLESQKDPAEALRWAKKDWDNRHDIHAADALAWAYYHNGLYDDAFRISEEALRSGSQEKSLLFHSALIRFKLRQYPQARTLLQLALACPSGLRLAERSQAEKVVTELNSFAIADKPR